MGAYSAHVLPWLIHAACSLRPIRRQREKVLPQARGSVLELGIGSGLNLPLYDPTRVSGVWGLDPSAKLLRMAKRRARQVAFPVRLLRAEGESIPLADGSVDTVVVTYALCTIADARSALAELRRVLRPGGALLFCEHGAAPDARVRRWQDRLTPVWKRVAGGCHLNRAIPALIEAGGFRIVTLETRYLPGWRPATFHYWGAARPDA